MKTILYTGLVLMSLSSCKKNFRCECTLTKTSSGDYINTESNTYKERKREDAQSACTAKSSTDPSTTKKCVIVN